VAGCGERRAEGWPELGEATNRSLRPGGSKVNASAYGNLGYRLIDDRAWRRRLAALIRAVQRDAPDRPDRALRHLERARDLTIGRLLHGGGARHVVEVGCTWDDESWSDGHVVAVPATLTAAAAFEVAEQLVVREVAEHAHLPDPVLVATWAVALDRLSLIEGDQSN
jgi:hypothetical protein